MMSDGVAIARFWWLKRLALGIVVIAVGVGASHWMLWRWADGRLAEQRAAWVAMGYADPDEALTGWPPPVEGEDNAAVLVAGAYASLPPYTKEQNEHWNHAPSWAFPPAPKQLEMVRQVVEQDRPTVEAFRGVYERPRVDWGVKAVAIEGILSRLNEARNLANHLSWGLQVHHHDGDIPEALWYAKDLTWLGMATVNDGHTLVTSLVSAGIESMAVRRIVDDMLKRRPPGMSAEAERAAWREARPQVLEVIALLLDAAYERRLINNAFRGEWTTAYSIRQYEAGWGPASRNLLTAPFYDAQLADHLTMVERVADAAEQAESFGQLQPHLAAVPAAAPTSMAGVVTQSVLHVMDPSFGRAGPSYFRAIADRRMAAILLALKLYEADHEGQLPATLEELVPHYLPHIPLDCNTIGDPAPFDPDQMRIEITGVTPATQPATQPVTP